MFNFSTNLKSFFKEEHWKLKFLLPYCIQTVLLFCAIVSSYSSAGTAFVDLNPVLKTIIVFFSFVSLIFGIISLIILPWYYYEQTQSSIENRSSKLYWKENFSDVLKRSFKIMALGIVYYIIPVLIITVLTVIFVAIAVLVAGPKLTVIGPANIPSLFTAQSAIIIILACCFVGLIMIGMFVYQYTIVVPAILRTIHTNTFSEGLKLNNVLKIGKKYFWQFLFLGIISLIITGVFGTISGIASTFTNVIFNGSILLQILVNFSFSALIAIPTTYFSVFFLPRLTGSVYRNIIKKDE